MIEIGYEYLHRTNHNYNKEMILDTKKDLKQFNNLFNAGFDPLDRTNDDDDDVFRETDDNQGNIVQLTNIKADIKEIVDDNDDPFNDS